MEELAVVPSIPWIGILFVIVEMAAGIAVGWWLHSTRVNVVPDSHGDESQRAREALARLHELTTRVAADVGQHSSRVQEITDELASKSAAGGDIEDEAVLATISRIIEANETMQQQLVSAEERLKEQEQQIESHAAQARTDALTKLANRRAFDDDLQQRFAEWDRTGTTFCLMILDIDHFKKFNDVHGHLAGDEVLRRVAGTLNDAMREMDLVARYGGEEFAVIFPATGAPNAKLAAERARLAIQRSTYRFETKKLQVTVSEGVAEVRAGEDEASLIRRADEALYASKEAGRNCAHYHTGSGCEPINPPPQAPVGSPDDPADGAKDPSAVEPHPAEDCPPAVAPKFQIDSVVADDESVNLRTDRLTGLPNHATFLEDVGRRVSEWRRYGTSPLSLMLVEVDHLDSLAAEHGEVARDLVLHTVTQFLTAAMREMDLVARSGASCFSILLPGSTLENAAGAAQRLRTAIARCPLKLKASTIHFTVSIGVAEARGADDAEALIEKAATALATSISGGGDCTATHDGEHCEVIHAAQPAVS